MELFGVVGFGFSFSLLRLFERVCGRVEVFWVFLCLLSAGFASCLRFFSKNYKCLPILV